MSTTINSKIKLGPLTKAISNNSSWVRQDNFPANQILADEVERILSFLQTQGQFEVFLPKLKGKLSQRDGALAEARVAFFFHRNGYSVPVWEPKGNAKKIGEFEIQWADTQPIFVEVKGPSWVGELNQSEKFGPRRQQPRYMNADARWVDPVDKIMGAAEKAAPKFLSNRPNLLVVAGYLLFLSPRELPRNVVEPKISSKPSEKSLSTIGGIVVFDLHYTQKLIEYQTVFIENPHAEPLCILPKPVSISLKAENERVFLR